jgi:hypothetical protein
VDEWCVVDMVVYTCVCVCVCVMQDAVVHRVCRFGLDCHLEPAIRTESQSNESIQGLLIHVSGTD